MPITDDAFELVRELAELRRIATESGNLDLSILSLRISERVSNLSRKLTDLLEERDRILGVLDEAKQYKMSGGSGGPSGSAGGMVTVVNVGGANGPAGPSNP